MRSLRGAFVCILLVFCSVLSSKIGLAQTPAVLAQREALFKQHRADFDYLLGDWEFSGIRKQRDGSDLKLRGYLTAIRFPKGAVILVQDRFLNEDGSTFFEASTIIAYNAALDQWEMATTDDGGFGTGLQDHAVAHRVGNEMQTEAHFATMSSRPSIWRIRHYDIQPDSYSVVAERSTDGGATWQKDYERVQVRRLGPTRTLAPLITRK